MGDQGVAQLVEGAGDLAAMHVEQAVVVLVGVLDDAEQLLVEDGLGRNPHPLVESLTLVVDISDAEISGLGCGERDPAIAVVNIHR